MASGRWGVGVRGAWVARPVHPGFDCARRVPYLDACPQDPDDVWPQFALCGHQMADRIRAPARAANGPPLPRLLGPPD